MDVGLSVAICGVFSQAINLTKPSIKPSIKIAGYLNVWFNLPKQLTNNDNQAKRADNAINHSQSIFKRAKEAIIGGS